ncbi:uncharacterized protein LOC121374843 [Gigantopelta aegis]|uniref:uncharacterized protein LOC121374843 n=1 Tax=Gigantopelta aegis TaxID=1735272 RepID=UPI001B88AA6E|nr:uncharacterized protein LOC121374843 [Gigantopelta aegis]
MPVNVREEQIISVNSLLKLVFDKPVKINHRMNIESALLTILQISTPDCCSKVALLKQRKMVDLNGKTKWLLEFQVSIAGVIQDASELNSLTDIQWGLLQTMISYQIQGQYTYTIDRLDRSHLLDPRHRMLFIFAAPLLESQLADLQNVIESGLYVNNVSVIVNTIPQEEFVNKWG